MVQRAIDHIHLLLLLYVYCEISSILHVNTTHMLANIDRDKPRNTMQLITPYEMYLAMYILL